MIISDAEARERNLSPGGIYRCMWCREQIYLEMEYWYDLARLPCVECSKIGQLLPIGQVKLYDEEQAVARKFRR
jgi:hypothetical protein